MTPTEAEKLRTALRWLRSHHHRLTIDEKSLRQRLSELTAEQERIARYFEQAETRLRQLEEL